MTDDDDDGTDDQTDGLAEDDDCDDGADTTWTEGQRMDDNDGTDGQMTTTATGWTRRDIYFFSYIYIKINKYIYNSNAWNTTLGPNI